MYSAPKSVCILSVVGEMVWCGLRGVNVKKEFLLTSPIHGFWVLGSGFWVLGSGFWVLGSGFWGC